MAMDSLLLALIDAVFSGLGYGVWWVLKQARVVRGDLSFGGAQVLGATAALGLVVAAIFIFW
jgi:hypothetical protein